MKTSGFVMQYFVFFMCFFNWNVIISVFTPPPLPFLPYLLCSIKSIIIEGQRKELNFYIERREEQEKLISFVYNQ